MAEKLYCQTQQGGHKGLFIAMPSRKTNDGEYHDIAHPINSETRERLQKAIVTEYENGNWMEFPVKEEN